MKKLLLSLFGAPTLSWHDNDLFVCDAYYRVLNIDGSHSMLVEISDCSANISWSMVTSMGPLSTFSWLNIMSLTFEYFRD